MALKNSPTSVRTQKCQKCISRPLIKKYALKMQSVTIGFTQVLPLIPFPLMIMTLIFIQMFNGEHRRKVPVFLKPIIGGIEPGSLGKPLNKEK